MRVKADFWIINLDNISSVHVEKEWKSVLFITPAWTVWWSIQTGNDEASMKVVNAVYDLMPDWIEFKMWKSWYQVSKKKKTKNTNKTATKNKSK